LGKFLFGNEIAVRATGLKAKIIIIDPAAAVRIRGRFLIVTNLFDATKAMPVIELTAAKMRNASYLLAKQMQPQNPQSKKGIDRCLRDPVFFDSPVSKNIQPCVTPVIAQPLGCREERRKIDIGSIVNVKPVNHGNLFFLSMVSICTTKSDVARRALNKRMINMLSEVPIGTNQLNILYIVVGYPPEFIG
jgi:hypothetical protein